MPTSFYKADPDPAIRKEPAPKNQVLTLMRKKGEKKEVKKTNEELQKLFFSNPLDFIKNDGDEKQEVVAAGKTDWNLEGEVSDAKSCDYSDSDIFSG